MGKYDPHHPALQGIFILDHLSLPQCERLIEIYDKKYEMSDNFPRLLSNGVMQVHATRETKDGIHSLLLTMSVYQHGQVFDKVEEWL